MIGLLGGSAAGYLVANSLLTVGSEPPGQQAQAANDGKPGLQGDIGPQGEAGKEGSQGFQGEAGQAGETGMQGLVSK